VARARADLHNALAVDRDIFRASLVDASLMDPVVRLDGGLPGTVRPFTVVREYQGPQGTYVERFIITSPSGDVLYESRMRRITLRGEAFEDRFSSDVEAMEVADSRPHTVTFYLGDAEVEGVPMFLETSSGGDARIATEETFKKALQKGAIMWVTVPLQPGKAPRSSGRKLPTKSHTQAVWFMWDKKSEKVFLLNGKGEQDVPGIAAQESVELSTRSKDERSLIARVPAEVSVVPLDDERWDRIGKVALTSRLNLPDGDAALERWKRDCTLLELTPQFGADDDGQVVGPPAAAVAAAAQATAGQAAAPAPAREEEPHVEAQVDQEVFDRLVGEGQPERVARAKAKAAYVRAERKRLKAEASAGAE
jgi:hypothetical protein